MAKEVRLKLTADASQAEKALAKFGASLKDIRESEFEPLNFAIGELEDRLYEMAASGDTTSDTFKEMSAEVGRMKKAIIDTDLAIDSMAQTTAQNMGGALGGVTAGFELAAGSMAVFGVDSAAVEEQLLKVQSAMAISQGLQGIKESISSFKALGMMIKSTTAFQWLLNVAMNANPIGLILAGVAALGAAIYALWSPIKKLRDYFLGVNDNLVAVNGELMTAIEGAEKLGKILDNNNKALDKLIEASRKRGQQALELLEAEGASDEEIHKQKLRNLKDEETFRVAKLKAAQTSYDSEKIAYKALVKEGRDEEAKALKEKLQTYKDNIEELKAADGDYYHNKKVLDIEEQKRVEQQRKDDYAKYKAHLERKLATEREIEDRKLALTFDNEKKEQEASRLQYERELADSKSRIFESAEQREEFETILAQEAFERRKEISAKWEAEISNIKLEGVKREEETIAEYKAQVREEQVQADTTHIQEDIDNAKAAMNARLDIAKSGFQALSDLANVFAGDSEAQQRKAFNINKAAGIAQATIETYQAASGAYASQMSIPSPDAPIRAAVAAGIAVASGIARVAAIAKTQFGGAGGVSSTSVGGSVPTAEARPAQFNVVGNTGTNQLAETLGSQPLKAYVVGADVTTQQSLDRNKTNTASL
jgi:hypothetical protein